LQSADLRNSAPLCLAFTGSLYPQALEAAGILAAQGIRADLYNLRFLKPIDEDYLAEILCRYRTVAFIEEGVRSGGFGEYAADLAVRRNCSARPVVLGVEDVFAAQGKREELLRLNGLDGPGIAAAALAAAGDTVRRETKLRAADAGADTVISMDTVVPSDAVTSGTEAVAVIDVVSVTKSTVRK
jgi:deoxyxylulose-5-phosphate synthase